MKLALINGYGEKPLTDKTYYTIPLGSVRAFYDLGKALAKAGHEVWFYHVCGVENESDYANIYFRDYSELHRKIFCLGEELLSAFDCVISFEGWDKESRNTATKSILLANNISLNPEGYDKIVCVSKYQKDYVVNQLGISDSKVGYISWGIDCNMIDSIPEIKRKRGELFFSGNPLKGLSNIKTVFDKLSEKIEGLHLTIISSNILYGLSDMDIHIKERNELLASKNIIYLEPVSYLELLKLMKSYWLFFAPQTIQETFGLTFLEAAACGIPSITLDVGGNIPSLISKLGSGIVAKDNDDFINKFLKLYNDDTLWINYQKNGIMNSRNIYTWERCVRQLETILQ